MFLYKRDLKKVIRFSLLLYSIVIGLAGTVNLIAAIIIIPKGDLHYLIEPLIMMGIYIYGSCTIALIISFKFFRK
ncbi:hypothetical protein CHH51_09320 [Terribacillus saccharophilus]|nr:hypothetical protein CHH51_09320 [Terribacillus saccharophilus]